MKRNILAAYHFKQEKNHIRERTIGWSLKEEKGKLICDISERFHHLIIGSRKFLISWSLVEKDIHQLITGSRKGSTSWWDPLLRLNKLIKASIGRSYADQR
jgi:hypothetical protein